MSNNNITDEELQFCRDFIAGNPWVFAKTYAEKAPHEYTAKRLCKDHDSFVKFIGIIHDRGIQRPYFKQIWTYLLVDGWEYFTHNTPDKYHLEVINRARPE